MKKTGFTLIELMATLVILGIVAFVVFPQVTKIINKNKQNAYKIQIEEIKKAAESWTLKKENIKNLPVKEGEELTLTLGTLKRSGDLNLNIKNPVTKELFPNDMLIVIKRKLNNFVFEVKEDSGSEETYDENAPTLLLQGNYLEYVELNTPYEEKGVIAYSKEGADITSRITQQILYLDNEVSRIDTSSFKTYVIHYAVTDKEKTSNMVRTVIVGDTTPPEITLEDTTEITISEVKNFDPLKGVQAKDNSEEEIVVTYKGEVKEQSGRYILTYYAKDKSGNESMKKRLIKVK